MSYSERLNEKHESNISPEILDKLDRLKGEVDPRFAQNLEQYRAGVLDLLSNNAAYADHPRVRAELEKQNSRIANVFSSNYERKARGIEFMKAANDDNYGLAV